MQASRMARISAWAVGSWLWATLLALSASISPSLTITVANGLPPLATFCRARSTVRCAKSVTGPLSVDVLVSFLESGLVDVGVRVLGAVIVHVGVHVLDMLVFVIGVWVRVCDVAVVMLVRMRALVGVLFGHRRSSPCSQYCWLTSLLDCSQPVVTAVMPGHSGAGVFGVVNRVDDELPNVAVLQAVEDRGALATGLHQSCHSQLGQVLGH